MKQKDALNEAIKLGGGLEPFTKKIGASSTHAVRAWRTAGIPPYYCPVIERVTGVACERLRPDVEWYVLRRPIAG